MDDYTDDVASDSEATNQINARQPTAAKIWQGNSYDVTALTGAIVGGLLLFSCFTCNFAFYCWPVLAIVLGIVGLLNAKDSMDPERTTMLSWVGIGTGGAIIVLVGLVFVLYFGAIIFAITMEGGGL